jgi:type II secretory pathway component GspD/PulD (secretin)
MNVTYLERREAEEEKGNIRLEKGKKKNVIIIIKQKNTWESVRELIKQLSLYVVSVLLKQTIDHINRVPSGDVHKKRLLQS